MFFVSQPKYYRQLLLKEATFETVCGGEAPVFETSHPKRKKSVTKLASDSEDDNVNGGLSSDDDVQTSEMAAAQKQKKRQKQNDSTPESEPKAKKSKVDKGINYVTFVSNFV